MPQAPKADYKKVLFRILRIASYLASLIFPFLLENVDVEHNAPSGAPHAKPENFAESHIYRFLTSPGFQDTRADRVATVALDRRLPDNIFRDICDQRTFMAGLVRRIAEARPTVIVVDKYFSPTACRNDVPTQDLAAAFAYAAKQGINVVVGLRTYVEADLSGLPPEAEAKLRSVPQVLSPFVDFRKLTNLENSDLFGTGLIRLNADERKVPLTWQTYGEGFSNQWQACLLPEERAASSSVPDAGNCPSLALSAARADMPNIETYSQLHHYLALHRHPLSGFIAPTKISGFSAADVVCGSQLAQDFKIHDCKAITANEFENGLRHRVVVVGDDNPQIDRHHTPYGEVPGFILQANYIEHLLKDRYFRPSPVWIEFVLSLAWVLIIELSFRKTRNPERTGLLLLLAMVVVIFVCWLLVVAFMFTSFGGQPGALLALIIRYVERRGELFSGQRAADAPAT